MEKIETEKLSEKKLSEKQTEGNRKQVTADEIQPRRFASWIKGKIHYDKDTDIFYLGSKKLTQKDIVLIATLEEELSGIRTNNDTEQLATDEIQPRRFAGWMKGKIHYDKDADIFNLSSL